MNSNFWDEKFAQSPNLYGEKPNVFFKEILDKHNAAKILLPGEGEGRNALYAASKGWQVIALDQSEIGRQSALKKAERNGLKLIYHLCDITKYEFEPESHDAIALIYFHLPLEIRDKIHGSLSRSLRKKGLLIIEGFGKSQLQFQSGGPKNIDMLYHIDEIKNSFPNMTWEYEFEGEVILTEGTGHMGLAHVVRLIGKKQ
jgi:hypothetical protein